MDDETLQIAALLKREYPFQGLSIEQLIALAGKFDVRRLADGVDLVGTKQHIQKFYIVFEGQVQIELVGHRGDKIKKILTPGDYFGDEFMLTGHSPSMIVKSIGESVLLSLEKEQFDSLMKEYPTVHTALNITMHSRRLARSRRFFWVAEDEWVFLILRKHVYFLILSLIFPILLMTFSMVLFGIGMANTTFLLGIGAATFVIGFFWFLWRWKDWGNDYYIVTNQRVVWIEKIILLYDSREEAALYNVLNERIHTTWLGRIFIFGDVFADTYTGEIAMRRVDNYLVLYSYIEGLRNRAKQLSRELEEKQMEAALAEAMQKRYVTAPEDVIPAIPAPPPLGRVKEKKAPKKKESVNQRWEHFLKYRYEQDGIITYRKAMPILIAKIWLPLLLLLVWGAGVYFSIQLHEPSSYNVVITIFMGVSLFGLLFWLIYNYVDWRNDIYQLTPTKIIDIEKKPLGAERFNSADIENILTITHQMNFIGNLFNFGNVIVTVGMTEFVFLFVHNPSRVHQEVANKQEALRRLKQQAEEARERERMINWLVAFAEETGKN